MEAWEDLPEAEKWILVTLILKILTPAAYQMVSRAVLAAINGGIDMIKLKHIYKSYSMGGEQVDVLHDINLHVKPKEFISILGPSGSGKSTLMNIIGCLDIPDSGDYILNGEYVDSCTENELSEIRGKKNWIYISAI